MKRIITEVADTPIVRSILIEMLLTPKFVAWYDLPFVIELNVTLAEELHDKLDANTVCYRVDKV